MSEIRCNSTTKGGAQIGHVWEFAGKHIPDDWPCQCGMLVYDEQDSLEKLERENATLKQQLKAKDEEIGDLHMYSNKLQKDLGDVHLRVGKELNKIKTLESQVEELQGAKEAAYMLGEDAKELEKELAQATERITELEEILKAVAEKPYKDSDLASLLQTLRKMAEDALDNAG